MSERIRILLVDDHALFRSGVRSLIQKVDEFEIVGEAGDGLEGAKRAKQLKPDVVLLDLHMPGINGLESLKLIHEGDPTIHVLMLTVSEESDDLLRCLRAGATGYLLKNIEVATLTDAIRMASRGEFVISPRLMGALLGDNTRSLATEQARPEASVIDRLSQRERDVLVCLARGQSNKEIARVLDLAESTVKIHVQSILKKLELSSRVQAAVYAVEHGFGPVGGAP
ncbi:MAG TPA: response regulator transcription factor [Rhodocyclaceae bacterium]|mgnify:CR=1 FL=1|nr:response regulator transcription factor [Rhodocyclaceae bacterium]HMV53431.1 response regulator transcription factor [Rhodocyclaceae bacterium]HMZ83739.1 response regulator transcription factor [Rhodocyclaceae bacterium]HNB79467.1 response regulator transcription factor [Rhodocyclaceae bacterium]HNH13473.1 response regulator transcription factor [Rhodocyclaceae bacterium]